MRLIPLLMASLIVCSTIASAQGDEHVKKPEKVSSATMQEEKADTPHQEAGPEGDTKAAHDPVTERDFDTIRTAVQSSTTFIVIKALALAVAIIGLAVVYLPRKRAGA